MTPAELYDSMHLPTTRWTPWRKREDPFAVLGDMTNGMVCEVERVPMIPKHPCYPADARVPKSQKKKDSVVSSGSKSRSLSTQSTSIVKGKGKQRERSLSAPIKEQGHGDPEDSDDSGPLCYQFLDAYCEPLSKGGSHISWAPTSPVMGPKNWWLEKKRRLSSTSFISPAGRRASSGTMGDVERGPTPVSREAAMCRRCFEPNRNGSVVKREGWKAAIGLTVANLLFPAVGGALILWSYVHPEMEDLFVLSVIPFSLWMIFLTVILTLWRPAPKPKCTCKKFGRRRETSPLLQRARRDLDELEKWRWERRRRSSKGRKFSSHF